MPTRLVRRTKRGLSTSSSCLSDTSSSQQVGNFASYEFFRDPPPTPDLPRDSDVGPRTPWKCSTKRRKQPSSKHVFSEGRPVPLPPKHLPCLSNSIPSISILSESGSLDASQFVNSEPAFVHHLHDLSLGQELMQPLNIFQPTLRPATMP